MTDVLNRTVYTRMFRGTMTTEADSGPWGLVGSLYDRVRMPALVLDPGKQIYYDFKLDQNESATLALPADYAVGAKLYIAVQCSLLTLLTYTSPTHGVGQIVKLNASNDATLGVHAGFWCYQGDMTTFVVSIPNTGAGGATTLIQCFMYEIPDLSDAESYYDQEIGLGHT